MPKKLDRCVKAVKQKMKHATTYINKNGKRVKSSPYAICKASIKKK